MQPADPVPLFNHVQNSFCAEPAQEIETSKKSQCGLYRTHDSEVSPRLCKHLHPEDCCSGHCARLCKHLYQKTNAVATVRVTFTMKGDLAQVADCCADRVIRWVPWLVKEGSVLGITADYLRASFAPNSSFFRR